MHQDRWISDNIELLEPIAEGAMGSVWRAHHHRLRSYVAVKFVSDKLNEDRAEALARFETEAAAAAQISSPHVVRVFDSGITRDQRPYIVMELLEGESLGDRIRREDVLSLNDARIVCVHVSRALAAAHARGIIHRDIKPDNIFLCHDGEGLLAKVLDFGVAKETRLPEMGGLTNAGHLIGTPEFLSPDQVVGEAGPSALTDSWALAVTMYRVMTGRLPFEAETLGKLCLALAKCEVVPASLLQPSIPEGVDAWFARALNKDATQRYRSAREMGAAFSAAVSGGQVSGSGSGSYLNFGDDTVKQFSTSSSLIPAAAMAPKPRRGLVAVAGLGVVAALAGLIWQTQTTPAMAVSIDAPLDRVVDGALVACGEAAAAAFEERAAVDAADVSDQTGPEAGPKAAHKPVVNPRGAPVRSHPSPPVAPPEPAATAAPAARPRPRPGIRGEKDLGF